MQSHSSIKKYDPPSSVHSVGWTKARVLQITGKSLPVFHLICGGTLKVVNVEYEAYGKISGDNVILVMHALSGDAHAAGWDCMTEENGRSWRKKKPGWWDALIGPGKALDTNRFCVICPNVLGGCYGTTGPSDMNPETKKPYGLQFPMITVRDWVNMEKALLERLNIHHLYAVCGGSLGGQQALAWAMAYPDWVGKCMILASGPKLPVQGVGFNAVARHAIMNDPCFCKGDYYGRPKQPDTGLTVARMLGHITYLSGRGMDQKFGRSHRHLTGNVGFESEFEVENYLDYQGRNFVERFDANSYLYITSAMDYFDAAENWGQGDLVRACTLIKAEMLVVAFSSDWLYPPDYCREFVNALLNNNMPVTYVELESESGHDAFLVDTEPVGRILKAFLLTPSRRRQLRRPMITERMLANGKKS